MRKSFFLTFMMFLFVLPLSAQEKKRAMKPISFKVVSIEPTTFITYEPFKVTYRLEYLKPGNGKEVKILTNLDKNHFQIALGTPVDVDFREHKKKALKRMSEDDFNALKLDCQPRIVVSDLRPGNEVLLGDRIRRDYVVTLKLIRDATTSEPFPVIRLELPEVSIDWAVPTLGQKEGEYEHEEPVKSGKVSVNHVLTTPTHDSKLVLRDRLTAPGYSSKSVSWFFWGIPSASFLLVGFLGLVLVNLYKRPVRTVEYHENPVTGPQPAEEISGVRRLKFNIARAELWEAVISASNGLASGDQDYSSESLERLYGSLNNLLLSALPYAPVGSLPADFVRILSKNPNRTKTENALLGLALVAKQLQPFYESIGKDGNVVKDTGEAAKKKKEYSGLVLSVRFETLNLWRFYRFFHR